MHCDPPKRAQILNELIKKNLNARAGGRLNFENYWLKNVAIINYIFMFDERQTIHLVASDLIFGGVASKLLIRLYTGKH